jgi:hypothetical protein
LYGTKLFRSLLPDSVARLKSIQFETSPGRRDERFTGDNTAFDLVATVTTPRGTRAFVGIEVKFAESMKYQVRPIAERINQLADQAQLHRDPRGSALRQVPLEQLFRQHLLATTMIGNNGPYQEGTFLLIAPEQNRDVTRAAQTYRAHLRDDHEAVVPFRQVTVEACIKAIGKAGDTALAAALHERYADFDPVHALIGEWEPHQPATQE